MAEVSEFSEEQNSERPDVERYMNLVRRRHIHFLIPVFLGWLVGWGAGWVLPARYQSTTLILVEQPSMPKDYVSPNVSEDLQDRLQSITEQILSRTRLLTIIGNLHLYGEGRDQTTPDKRVALMRKDIDVELVYGQDKKQITGFTISYSARNPQIAQQVTTQLTDLFIDENLKARQQESQDTTSFLESRLEDARTNLADQEAKVDQYDAKHVGELPSQQASNIQILNGLQSQLQNEQDARNTAKQQGIYLQALIGQYQALNGTSRTADTSPTSLPAIDQQLDTLSSKLTNLSAHYTDRYPDVQNLKDEIAKTEKMRDELLVDLKAKSTSGGKASQASVARDTRNGVQNSALAQVESQLQANKVEITNREQSVASLKARIDQYQARLNDEPAREQELDDLTRGYDQSKANYDDLLKKKNESALATSMEQMQQGERFTMLDPPSLPASPAFPNRLKLCGIGLGVGLALGLLVVGGLELTNDRLYGEKEIKTLLPVAILADIPEVVISSDERSTKKRTVLGWTMAALITATILAGFAFTYLQGSVSNVQKPF
jgi:polysaccharide chain length determinant protein (PEP-CTERM system associated)